MVFRVVFSPRLTAVFMFLIKYSSQLTNLFSFVIDEQDSGDDHSDRGRSHTPEPRHQDERPLALNLVSFIIFHCTIQVSVFGSVNIKI